MLEGARHAETQHLRIERLHEKVERAVAHGRHRDVHRRVAGHHDDDEVGARPEQALAQLDARHLVHVHVGEHEIEIFCGDEIESSLRRDDDLDRETLPLQEHLSQLRFLAHVVHDQHTRCAFGLVAHRRTIARYGLAVAECLSVARRPDRFDFHSCILRKIM